MKRHISIIIFVTLFISAVSAIAIIIAKGYTIKEDEIRENGIIDIESTPSGATIYIDGVAKDDTPKKIELVTGTHEISISKEGYKTWKKELTVEPTVVTEVLATLIPSELEVEQATFVEVNKAFFSDDGNIALYTVTESSNKGIWVSPLEKSIFTLSTTEPTKIGKISIIPQDCQDNGKYTFTISNDNKKVLLECEQGEGKLYKLIDLENPDSVINLNEVIGFYPTDIRFGYMSTNLIISDDEILSSYSINTGELILLARKTSEFSPQLSYNNQTAYLLKNEYNTSKKILYKYEENTQPTQINTNINMQVINSISSPSTSEIKTIGLSGKDGSYLILKDNFLDPIRFSKKEVTFIEWSKDGLYYLFAEGNALKSARVREMPNKSINVDTYKISDNYEDLKWTLDWSQESNQIVIDDLSKNTIYLCDFDGQNKTLLFSGELTYAGAFKLSVNETFLVVLLPDSKNSSNLYTVKLKI